MALTDTAIRIAKPGPKPRKLYDERGLYLLLNPNGSRWWRFKYRFGGKEKLLSFGTYPEVPLSTPKGKTPITGARQLRDDARALVQAGIDPSAYRKAESAAKEAATTNSFEAVAREWHAAMHTKWTAGHAQTIMDRLERDAFPWMGLQPVTDITPPELLKVLRRIASRGALETAHRVGQICSQVFRYAIATGRADRDPYPDLRGALPPTKQTHLASITEPARIGELLRALHGYTGHFPTLCALKLAPLVFVRPGELRAAEWSEFNLDAAEWRIPAARMKAGELHIVPLSNQALAILRELHPRTSAGRYVFPSTRSAQRPMSENTVTAALRRLDYASGEMTGHGFRSMASTLLNEQGWHRDAIERQLAHGERNKVRAAYNYAEHLPERRKMMQAWADYLDGLRARANASGSAPS